MPQTTELKPKITVFGVGGAGGNAVNNMIAANLEGVDFVAANTDAQSLHQSLAECKIQMGAALTEGLGAGSRPEIGCGAAEESLTEILDHLANTHMVFITAGMGGGTGTGAGPVIAQAAREQGILTVGVVTKPFQFEGARRMRIAEAGIIEMQKYVDTLIIIPNQNLFRVANEKTTFADAFAMADEVLHSGVRGITDLMVMPGLINLDFADVRTVMDEMGKAMMGTGEATGDNRAIESAEAAISNPLLDEVSMKGARGVLINITGGMDLTLFEVDEAANRIRAEVDSEANIIVGSTFNEELDGSMRVSVVATGIAAEEDLQGVPTEQSNVAVLKRPSAPAWRGKGGGGGQTSGIVSAVGNTAVAPQTEPEMAQESKAELIDTTIVEESTAEPQEAQAIPRAQASPAADLIKKASDFAQSKERKPLAAPATAEVAAPETVVEAEPVAPIPPLEIPAEDAALRMPRPKRKRGGLFGLRKSTSRLFADDEIDATKDIAQTPAPQPEIQPKRAKAPAAEGMVDAPPVKVEPQDRLTQNSLAEEQLEIPAFLRRP
jgi:cell division protein FtsZ